MPDMREGDWGTTACYLTVERLTLQAGVESPFWDETSLLMGGCEGPWYKKPLTPRRLRLFLKRYGGSLPDDDGQRGHAASVFADVMRLHGIPMEDGTAMRRGGYTDSPIPRITTASPRPSHHQITLTSRGMIGYAHVRNDEGTSSPRTPQRYRPSRRFTAAPCLDGKTMVNGGGRQEGR